MCIPSWATSVSLIGLHVCFCLDYVCLYFDYMCICARATCVSTDGLNVWATCVSTDGPHVYLQMG